MRALAAVCLLLLPTLAIAGWGTTQGDGNLKTETRDLRGFTHVEIGVPIDLTLKQGDFQVKLTVDSNLLSKVQTKVENGVLSIRTADGTRGIDPHQKARLEISLPELKHLAVQGSSDVNATGFTRAEAMKIEIQGSGDVNYEGSPLRFVVDINGSGDVKTALARELAQTEVQINGSGAVNLAGVGTQKLAIEVHGSGDVDTRKLPARDGAFSVSGSGGIRTHLTGGQARFEVDGSGDIEWSGTADVRAKLIEGSGEVRQIRE